MWVSISFDVQGTVYSTTTTAWNQFEGQKSSEVIAKDPWNNKDKTQAYWNYGTWPVDSGIEPHNTKGQDY